MDRRAMLMASAGAAAWVLTGCRSSDTPAMAPVATLPTLDSPQQPLRAPRIAGRLATGLNVPWGLCFVPDGSCLVTSRDAATVTRVWPDGRSKLLGTVDGVVSGGEGGLLGITYLPAEPKTLYVYCSTAQDNRVIALNVEDVSAAGRVVFDGIARGPNHQGGALLATEESTLFVATGDAGDRTLAQRADSPNGKILHITADGEAVGDSIVYSRGHRNVQGLAFDDHGQLWASEFGDKTADELNRIEEGKDYGWPRAEGDTGAGGVRPFARWPTDQASPSGLAVSGNRAFLAGLRGERLWEVDLQTGRSRDHFVGTYGRLRALAVAPDGSLWLGTSNTDGRRQPGSDDDMLMRVVL